MTRISHALYASIHDLENYISRGDFWHSIINGDSFIAHVKGICAMPGQYCLVYLNTKRL